MKTIELLKNLKDSNIDIEIKDGELDIIVNDNNLSDELLNHIKNKKNQLLEHLKDEGKTGIPSDFTFNELKLKEYRKLLLDNEIDYSNVDDIYNLTPLQEGFLFHSIMDKDSSVYFEQISLDLKGDLDVALVKESWELIISRHDPLRTLFISDFRIPLQLVLKERDLDFSYMDIREEDNKEKTLDEIKRTDKNKTFNLKADPLFRITLIKRDENQYSLMLSFHHMILDGWCMPLIISEFLENYEKLINKEDISFDLSVKYSEYISWLNSRDKDKDLEYWKGFLEGYEEFATIPKDSQTELKGMEEQLNYSFSISKEQTDFLKKYADEIGVTFNTLIQTVWGIVLSRYNGKDDVVFGSTVSGRPQDIAGIEKMVGLFINTIPVRIRVEKDKSFKDVATDVQRNALESIEYHYSSLADIQRDCGLGSALLDHIMVFENYPINEALKEKNSSSFEIDNVESFEHINYDFGITVFPSDSLSIKFSYNPEKYSRESLERIASHIEKTITEILSNNEILVGEIDIIPEEEKNLILNIFNDTKTDYPKDKTIVDLFEEQVEKTPDNIAVVFEDVELTYRELNEKSNIVGHYLRNNYDIKPDDMIAVMLDRSEKMVIALLGILKSGAAYIPIDPDFPQERIDFILVDLNPKVAIVDNLDNKYNDMGLIPITEMLQYSREISNPEKISQSINLAYVIYTSGSTGQPKGTLLEHSGFINMVFSQIQGFGINVSDNILQFASTSFDASMSEIFMALFSGSSLVVVSKESKTDIDRFQRVIIDNNITVATLPPSYLTNVSEKTIKRLRILITAGENPITSDVMNYYDSLKYINAYGPTEASVCISFKIIDSGLFNKPDILIGKPISNIQVYILDINQQLLPLGASGELCISGPCLARGYLNRSDQTSEKFINNPYIPGERMYRTGDLARWLPDGNLEFLGRIDNQVKIRGFRIEPGEIESVLQNHLKIINSVVVAKENNNGDKQLVTYYSSDNKLEILELRSFLERRLPEYMVPSCFIHMDSLPLTLNGKIDVKALPESDGNYSSGTGYVAPKNETEKKLVEIWEEILGVDKIGIHDNFFSLGGHSLKALRIVSRISKELNVSVFLKDIFSNPTIVNISELIKNSTKKEYKQIEEISEQDSYELSSSQRRIWILDQLKEKGVAYNMPSAFTLKGKLKTDVFREAYSFMLERHESLRTVFVTENGEPRQKILKNPDFKIETVDLKNSSDPEGDAQILAEKNLLTPFNLETGALVRLLVIRIEDEKNLLLFNMHHIISDGWSMNIFIKEFLACYSSFNKGNIPVLKPLRIHYKDYSAWQSELLDNPGDNRQREYWFKKLSGELPVLDLPSDSLRPATQTFNGKSLDFSLSKKINADLNNLCLDNQVSLFMLLQSLVKVLFYRYTGQNDIILGSPVAGRVHEDLENQIGFYVNTLVIRDTITGETSFKDVLNEVGKSCTDAFDNQDYPFDQLVEDFEIKRDLSRSPLFDVMLVLQNNDSSEINFDGLDAFPYEMENRISKFDMTFNFTEREEGLFCSIVYNPDIYSEDRLLRMCEHFKTLVSSVLLNPESRIKDLQIIPESEKNLLLNVFNDTRADYPKDKTIVDLFEEQVEKSPENIAVVFEGVELSYRVLNENANKVAHYLRNKYDIKPDDLVGVMLDRSEKMIIALLGILKSGAAYVPIDPEYPEDRIDYMIEDSNPKVVLSNRDENIFIDINKILENNSSYDNPVSQTTSDNLAYVIYTSGTTGKPKGVMIQEQSIINFLFAFSGQFEDKITENDNCLSIVNPSFDVSVCEIFSSLVFGARLFIYKNISLDLNHYCRYLEDNNISFVYIHPGLLKDVAKYLNKEKIGLNKLLVGVEGIKDITLNEYLDLSNIQILNGYGPTEDSICATFFKYSSKTYKGRNISIGSPISNTQIYILDKNKNLNPLGVPGELCISGSGLARGYLNRPELTAEKFIDNPVIPGERMYQTGDFARWLPDGNIEFLGRMGNQVKIRGFRIELGEIENTLQNHMDINISVVIAKEKTQGDKQLIAYYSSENELEISDLRSFLGKSLPDYMIPSFFIHMETLPLTPNSKIDRKALPEPDGYINTGVEYVAPRNEIEEKLVQIWQEVLGVEEVGVQDNFFTIGGHSLKATRVISQIIKELEVEIALRDIFESQTVETLSDLIEKAKKKGYKQIEVVTEQEYYNLSNAQRRLWVLDQFDKDSIAYNMPAAFILEGKLKTDAFRQAYFFIIERHESLRTVFITENGEPRQKVLKNPDFDIVIIDLRKSPDVEKEARALAEGDIHTPFDLETGPLVRFTIMRLEDEKYFLLYNMHHIISDGWSLGIFIKEFLASYESFKAGSTPELAPLRVHYKDYSAWQNDLLDSLEMDNQREYWLGKLSGELPVLDLPADNVRPVSQTFNGNNIGFALPEGIITGLNDLCLENKISLFMMLQALIKVLFHRYTGQVDIILGSPIAGRVHEDLENQIGFYVNTLNLRDTIEGNLTFKEFLESVKKTCTDAFDNQDYPFDKLVEELDVKRDLSRSPFFDVMLVLQNNETMTVEFDGLNLSPYNTENQVSKFDMTFNFSENEERLFCGIEYNTDIYSEDRLLRMCEHFKTLVSSILSNPESKIKDLEIIPANEKNLLLNVFNDTKADYPVDKTIVDLFEEQVEKTPDNVAVIFKDIELTYRKLNEKANLVGHFLRENYDIKPDDLVGVLLERSEMMIITLLGILKSGAAYVPIDPEYPEDRIDYMIEDSNPKVVLSNRDENIFIDINKILENNSNYDNPVSQNTPNNLAYLIYTSGSTGKPKGTLLEHTGLINMSLNQIREFEINDNILQFASTSFDASMYEIFMALFSGSSLVIVDEESKKDLNYFQKVIVDKNVSVATLPPSFLTNVNEKIINKLRVLITAGEKPINKDVMNYYSSLKYVNAYGPTEASVCISINMIDSNSFLQSDISIGKPISNIQVFILDINQQLLPFGSTGELCISGVGLARGYLNRDELTSEKFIDNPFIPGVSMFRTGDLARWLPDGNLEFLGRMDNQVKIRGFRIELGEIEHTLQNHIDINISVVIAKEKTQGDKQLIAYYSSENELEISDLRSFLGKSLPDYMIPYFFIHMETLPLTPNGKIDRKALPEPDGYINTGVEYVAPRNDIEETLANIWQDVLGIDKIGISDNFFDLGGHSLKATRVISQIIKEMEVDIALRDIFENQTVDTLSDLIENAKKKGYKQIEIATEQEYYDVSNAQRRLWVLDQFEKESITYNMPAAFILKGKLKTNVFRQVYSFMIGRHESLRTVFITDNGNPKQKILENSDFDIEIIDLRNSFDVEKEAKILVEKDLQTSFNLEVGPLIRFTILRLEDEKYLLLFNMHHIISDGWSMNIFIKELLASYESFKEGDTPGLSPLRIHYKDYSAWQNDLLDSSEMDNQREYWLEKLSGELPILELPADNVRPVTQSFKGNNIGFILPEEINSGLNDLCLENKVSLFMMLQALVKVLFYRYTGQEDIILGSPIAGRVHEDLEDQIGFYVNTLSLRDSIEGNLTFKEFLASVKKTCIDAFENQTYPFDSLVEELDIKRDMSHSPLFDVMLVLQNNDEVAVEFDGLNLSPYKTENTISKFDMTFNFSETGEDLFCGIEYNTDLYLEDRIKRMAKHLEILISSVIESPESRIKDLEIIPDNEKNLLLNVFNETKADYPADKTIVDLFEEQVEKTPDNVAVVFEDVELTYRELNEKANLVGHFLRENYDIKPDDLVGVLLGRSEKMIIALLGILKSGAAYVPLDPKYPEDRIDYMLKDSCPKVVLSEKYSVFENDIDILDINEVLESDKSLENPGTITKPNNLAYTIYTSGSTGKPKGTLIEHKSLINRIDWMQKKYSIGENDTILQKTTFTFDVSVWELFWWSLYGAKVCFLKPEGEKVPETIIDAIERNSITTIHFVPSMYIVFLSYIRINNSIGRIKSLKQIFCSGEELTVNHVKNSEYIIMQNGTNLINLYGPTEATIDVTFFNCKASDRNIPIGKPISNITLYVIDKNNNPTPLGVPGELCISGVGLARGYLNRPELTAEKFVENPFLSGERMYRTGDLARWLPDRNIEFLGRIDNQVKIRGFRIELGEIENSLVQHNEISSVVVVAKKMIDGDKQLIAYFISDKELELLELRNFLKKSLPDYMIPSFFIFMESFPLTPNGKIDRKAFPDPDGNVNTGVEYVAPRDEAEEKLAHIWQEVLGVKRIGIHDNFFEFGGQSLKATRVVSRINREFNVVVSLKEIFKYPSIQTLSEVINSSFKTEYKQIEVIPEEDSYEISNAQRRLWLLNQFEKDSIAYNMPSAFTLEGELNTDALNQAFFFMIERHESLRTVFVTENGEPRQKILKDPGFRIEIIDLGVSIEPEKEVEILAEKDLLTPFNLEIGALVRLSVIRIENEKNLLLFNMHHIISDGWSMNIFIREFLVCYSSFKEGNIPSLKPLRINYKDYSAWQNELLNNPENNRQREYWLRKLSGELPVLDLPSDSLRPVTQTFNGKYLDFSLSKEIHVDLNNLCLDNQVSLFMMLQALVKVLIYRYTGQSDIILGSPVAGRVHEDLEDQIGFYVNTLVFRDTITGETSFKDILYEVGKSCTEAFDNQDYPFDRLVEDLEINRDLTRSPLFDVMVVMQNNDRKTVDFEGLELSPSRVENVVSKFDMTFSFSENEEELVCGIEYNTDIYSDDRLVGMCEHFKTLVTSVLSNPQTKVKDLEIIGGDERNLLLNVFNDTKVEYLDDKTIIDLFEEQTRKTPDNVAVVFEDIELTYRELNKKANIVGHYLIDNYDIIPDDLIGAMLEQSEKMIITLLGILKSGAGYVPIDSGYPEARVQYMLEDSNPKVVISDREKDHFIDVNEILETEYSIENPKKIIKPDNLAYVIYTSGSTGKPKGVMIEHKSIVNTLLWRKEFYKYDENDIILQLVSYAFDSSVEDIFTPLISGSKLIGISNDIKLNTDMLLNIIKKSKVSIITLISGMYEILLLSNNSQLDSLRMVVVGGEKISTNMQDLHFRKNKNTVLYNEYGPTENSVCSTVYQLTEDNGILIGKPIHNIKICILDSNMKLLPQGVPGELCISGSGLARGYLNRPDFTATKFIDNPNASGERMYRTGDLARWNYDGNIEFLGRIDTQVKIRGFRIELGEIENSLLQYDNINLVVVLAKEGNDREKKIFAYYSSEVELELSELKSFLGKSLPDYMIPSSFIHMDSFPLTPNGKIDMKAFPEPDGTVNTGVEYVPPRNELEEKLVQIWEEVLGVERIGIHDNFFELGGHSLKATKVVSKLRKDLAIDFSLRDLFHTPTISSLVEIINSKKWTFNKSKLIENDIKKIKREEGCI